MLEINAEMASHEEVSGYADKQSNMVVQTPDKNIIRSLVMYTMPCYQGITNPGVESDSV